MEGPVQFRCPPEFELVTPSPPPGLCGAALGGPSTELWLIRAPTDFHPESLEGCRVPLDGCGQLQGDGDGNKRLYRLRGVLGGAGSALLLAPDSPAGPLACAPPLRGCLTITENFGPPPGLPVTIPTPDPPPPARRKKKKKMKEAPEAPGVLTPGKAVPSEGGECGPGPPPGVKVVPGEPEVPKKKKKHKQERAV
ncbi:DNA-directed RNA polymerase I subunit RPA34 [Phalacrocorax aristotelis]|uniref:DNA-directed RNA polymerase I subunit RPA34 n=1 Tax=Phalacrocorax aristotelis TaxID=126867 RepID=UPI003F4C4AF6